MKHLKTFKLFEGKGMEKIFSNFDEVNVEIYDTGEYPPNMILYVDGEYITHFKDFTEISDIQKLFPEYLVDLLGSEKILKISNKLHAKLNDHWRGTTGNLMEELDSTYPEDVSEFLMKEFKRMINEIDDPYYDNLRFCEVGNEEQEKEYTRKERNGCCGSEDREVSYNGKVYKIGFNFGH